MSSPKEEVVPIEDLEFAKKQLLQSSARLLQIKRQNYTGDIDEEDEPLKVDADDLNKWTLGLVPQPVISGCQVCVELSAKSIFKSVGVEPIESHDISLEHKRIEGVLNRLPSGLENPSDVPRVIFLTQFWERFYEISKYGVPSHNISSSDIMDKSDAKRAIRDADFCIETAEELHGLQMSRFDYEISEFDLLR